MRVYAADRWGGRPRTVDVQLTADHLSDVDAVLAHAQDPTGVAEVLSKGPTASFGYDYELRKYQEAQADLATSVTALQALREPLAAATERLARRRGLAAITLEEDVKRWPGNRQTVPQIRC